jgi:hypothetical protein
VHPEVANVLATTDRPFLDDLEKRLQKRLVVKARGSFHVEDFEIRSPNDKTPIEKSAAAGGGDDKEKEPKRRRRKKRIGPPAEVEAMLAEEEAASVVDPGSLADEEAASASHQPNGAAPNGHSDDAAKS